MPKRHMMQRLARWHIWLAWLAGVPILMWTVTGLVMVAKPIEEVRGNHLRIEQPETVLPGEGLIPLPALDATLSEAQLVMQRGQPIWLATHADGRKTRIDARSGELLPEIDEDGARRIAAQAIKGGDRVESVQSFDADIVPFDFRRPSPVWQVALEDGTHVYIGRQTGQIEAIRTRWWRVFDFMWGVHIMDLREREDTSHPVLILFATLAVLGSLFGVILMFRRRRGFLHR